jgi:hypothetical protein
MFATLNATGWILHFSSGKQLAHYAFYPGPVPNGSAEAELQVAEGM